MRTTSTIPNVKFVINNHEHKWQFMAVDGYDGKDEYVTYARFVCECGARMRTEWPEKGI